LAHYDLFLALALNGQSRLKAKRPANLRPFLTIQNQGTNGIIIAVCYFLIHAITIAKNTGVLR
jgi:hypothetical protein